jgi:hypothetical protein
MCYIGPVYRTLNPSPYTFFSKFWSYRRDNEMLKGKVLNISTKSTEGAWWRREHQIDVHSWMCRVIYTVFLSLSGWTHWIILSFPLSPSCHSRLPTAHAGDQSQGNLFRISGGPNGTGTIYFSEYFGFALTILTPCSVLMYQRP